MWNIHLYPSAIVWPIISFALFDDETINKLLLLFYFSQLFYHEAGHNMYLCNLFPPFFKSARHALVHGAGPELKVEAQLDFRKFYVVPIA